MGKAGRPRKPRDKGGRPRKYNPDVHPEQARRLCLIGYTDIELAEFFGIAESTLHKWKLDFPEFSEFINQGKVMADSYVVDSMYKRACGYEEEDIKIMQYEGNPIVVPYTRKIPADVTAGIFWLTNRQNRLWKRNINSDADNQSAMPDMHFHRKNDE